MPGRNKNPCTDLSGFTPQGRETRTSSLFPGLPGFGGFSCFIAIWHLIWRPDLGNSCCSSSGFSAINHVRRQRRYQQRETLQLGTGLCRISPRMGSPRKGLHLPVEAQGSLGTRGAIQEQKNPTVMLASGT